MKFKYVSLALGFLLMTSNMVLAEPPADVIKPGDVIKGPMIKGDEMDLSNTTGTSSDTLKEIDNQICPIEGGPIDKENVYKVEHEGKVYPAARKPYPSGHGAPQFVLCHV